MSTGWTTTAAFLCMCALATPSVAWAADKETNCSDRIDEDQDTVTDCADADCYDDPVCKTAGGLENSDVLCSDAIDNDGDGAVDCEDADCESAAVKVCQGSWEGPLGGTGIASTGGNTGEQPLPELAPGQSLEDLIGTGGDVDGERNDFVCSDGLDNDGDGAIDCADIGCRFDPNVNVCRSSPGIRFTFAAHVRSSYEYCKGNQCTDATSVDPRNETYDTFDTRVNRIQLRALGPVPFIQDSFFLISMRAERSPRLTFAMFSMPIGGGHYLNINSGGGGLSNGLVLSVSKNILLDPPFYLYSAFEAGNGAAVEVNGPLVYGLLDYRVFAAGGSGRFSGVVGGNFFNNEDRNYTYGVGGQLALYAMGRFDRWDTRFLYTPVPRALTLYAGGRYDQRDDERYPAMNIAALFRWGHFELIGETYGKRELNFDTWQLSYNIQAGLLVIPKWLFLAADFGQFYATEFDDDVELTSELRRIVDETQARFAAHMYVWRNVGLVSFLYTYRFVEAAIDTRDNLYSHEFRVETQFRF
ncbi:MAG: hypothetical protein RKU31_41605 [Deltaproteobacteria bacterium]|jgi:hypothetical protein